MFDVQPIPVKGPGYVVYLKMDTCPIHFMTLVAAKPFENTSYEKKFEMVVSFYFFFFFFFLLKINRWDFLLVSTKCIDED